MKTCCLLLLSMLTIAPRFARAEETPPPQGKSEAVEPAPAEDATPPIPGKGEVIAPQPAPVVAAPVVVAAPIPAPAAEVTNSPQLKAAFGEGFRFEVGNLKLGLRGRVQLRGDAMVPQGANTTRLNEVLIRRAQLGLKAEFFDVWRFELGLAFASRELEANLPSPLLDAHVTWAQFREANVRAGQTTVPFGRQQLTSDSVLQFADRSIVVGELNLDRDVGLIVRSDDVGGFNKRFAYQVGVMGGDGRNRLGTNNGLLFFGRIQVNPFGGFDDMMEADLKRSPAPRLAIGLSYARNNNTVRTRSTSGGFFKNGSITYDHAAADFCFKWRGISVIGEGLLRKADKDQLVGATTTEYSRSGWGYFVQAGAMITDRIEVAARWGDMRPFVGTDPAFVRQTELGGGASFYAFKHDLKVQADYFWLSGNRFEVGSHQVRLQVQVYF